MMHFRPHPACIPPPPSLALPLPPDTSPPPQTFIKVVNYTHIMPTRYSLEGVDLKGVVTSDCVDNSTKKVEANKAAKELLEAKFKDGKSRCGGKWLWGRGAGAQGAAAQLGYIRLPKEGSAASTVRAGAAASHSQPSQLADRTSQRHG